MRSKASLLFLALVSCVGCACADSVAAIRNDADLESEIMIGRTEVMHDQTARGLAVLGVIQLPNEDAQRPPDERPPFERLHSEVERYNQLHDIACGSRAISTPVCGEVRYSPPWYARPDTSAGGLKRMAEDMQGHTMPLWSAVCARATAKTGDKDFCAIE